MGRRLAPSIQKAREMVASGRGAESAEFEDSNQGRERVIRTSAAVYVSYFDPEGLAAMRKNAQKIARPVPVFLAIGMLDPYFGASKTLFASLPAHSASRRVERASDHLHLAADAAPALIEWLDALGF